MATSPIYNWPEPDNTDLVKNGALAIRTLGDAIDTTMATMTPKSIVDAKGDLIAASAADTPARLAVGNNGETLVADGSTSTGLRYTAGTVQSNPILNSAMSVWQRGTTFSLAASTTPTYVADRWMTLTNANQAVTISRQATGDTTNLPNIQYALRWQRNSGQTGTGGMGLVQSLETVNAIPFAGKTVTFSFYARKGANFSGSIIAYLFTGTGTDQNRLTIAYTGGGTAINQTFTPTTTWQRFSYTATFDSTVTEFAPYFLWSPSGTAGAADYLEITGVQIDIGSVALPFRTYAGTIQGELAACQRYYWRANAADTYSIFGTAIGSSGTQAFGYLMPNVKMRRMNSMTSSNIALIDGPGALVAVTLALQNNYTSDTLWGIVATAASGLTANRPYHIQANNNSGAFVAIDGEL